MVNLLREQGVASSNLAAPTNNTNALADRARSSAQVSAQQRQGVAGATGPKRPTLSLPAASLDRPSDDYGNGASQPEPTKGEPRKKASRLPEGTVGRGYPCKLRFSSRSIECADGNTGELRRVPEGKEQRRRLDLWRRRTMQLWNVLLAIEEAAYSGAAYDALGIDWRGIWAEIVEANHARDVTAYQEGGRRKKDGALRKSRRTTPLKEPAPLSADYLAKIRAEGCPRERPRRSDDGTIEERPNQPRLFLWERELSAIMARLKKYPQTAWIGDLPSRTAQEVCRDMDKAIKSMIRERKKKAAGLPARDWGFPRFKANRYAAGSIYFSNEQIDIDHARGRVHLPNGVGWVALAHDSGRSRDGRGKDAQKRAATRAVAAGGLGLPPKRDAYGLPPEPYKLMGARVWRRGEDWYVSIQAAIDAPKALAPTGRSVGVAITAKVMLTTYDADGRSRMVETPDRDERRAGLYLEAAKALSRSLEARKKKTYKLNHRQKRNLLRKGKVDRWGKPRRWVPFSRAFYEASAAMARLEAQETDARDLLMHRETAKIVQAYDTITVQRMDVAAMLKSRREKRHERREKEARETGAALPRPTPPKVVLKHLRKLNRRAAMGRTFMVLKQKALDAGRTFNETHQLFPDAQIDALTGELHPEMRDGRPYLHSSTGKVMERRKNRARNELQQGEIVRAATAARKRPPSPPDDPPPAGTPHAAE